MKKYFKIQHQGFTFIETWFDTDIHPAEYCKIAMKTDDRDEKLKLFIKLAEKIKEKDNRFSNVRVVEVTETVAHEL